MTFRLKWVFESASLWARPDEEPTFGGRHYWPERMTHARAGK